MSKNFFRRAGVKIASGLLCFLLFAAAGTAAVRFVLAEPATVKSAIARSGAYDHFIDAGLSTAQTTAKKEGPSDIPLNEPIIKEPLKQAFSPNVLQTNIENLIDGTYRWLNGYVAQPDFVLDFSTSNEAFLQGVGERLSDRLHALPPCTPQQIQAQKEVDALKATCLPPRVDIDQLVQQTKSKLQGDKDLLPDQKITADTFTKPGETQNVFASASNAPQQFQVIKQAPWILLGMSVLLAAMIVLLSSNRGEGLKRLGKILTFTGALILLIPLCLYFGHSALIDQKAINANQVARDVTWPLITEFGKAAGKIYLIFGGLTVIIGSSIWIAARKFLDKQKTNKTA